MRPFGASSEEEENTMSETAVRLTIVANELEADELCGLLQSEGIDCFQRATNLAVGMVPGLTGSGGPREVLVRPSDLERAQELLDAPASEDELKP